VCVCARVYVCMCVCVCVVMRISMCVCERARVYYLCVWEEHIELPARLLDCFLRSNKSNINQRFCKRQNVQWRASERECMCIKM